MIKAETEWAEAWPRGFDLKFQDRSPGYPGIFETVVKLFVLKLVGFINLLKLMSLRVLTSIFDRQ